MKIVEGIHRNMSSCLKIRSLYKETIVLCTTFVCWLYSDSWRTLDECLLLVGTSDYSVPL